MKMLKRMKLSVLLLVICGTCMAAEDPCEPGKPQLQFRISNVPKGWDASWNHVMQDEGITHVAVFRLGELRYWGRKYMRRAMLLRTEREGTRLERVAFKGDMKSAQAHEYLVSLARVGDSKFELSLYATSEKHAREEAQSLLTTFNNIPRNEVRQAEANIENCNKRISDIEEEAPEYEQKKPPIERKLEELKQSTYYRNRDDAEKSILEWNTLLNTVEVDIIGIKARLSKLREKDRAPLSRFVLEMQVAAEVDLAGALARQEAARSHREKALRFINLQGELDKVRAWLNSKDKQLLMLRDEIRITEDDLPQLRAAVKPVEVVGNEVTIYPVK